MMTILAILLAYCIGSISSAIITCKIMGLPDPRKEGSHNPGATNVLRIGGKKAAIFTLVGDVAKGVIPVLLAKWYGMSVVEVSLIAFATFLGHLYPIFFNFQGGKGVATAFGCLISLSWQLGLTLATTWLIIAVIFRYSSLAAILTALVAPFYTWYFTNIAYTLMVCLISLLLIYKHRSNIKNLLRGQEKKIGAPKA